jgi:NAD(P)-dependent dehydrogenase (short-subunit alcohol dehydrogenase family)
MGCRIAVTGVASGIGAALAALLSAEGHEVWGFDIQETSKNVARFIPLDLCDPASIDAAASAVDRPLDGLCNNAGLPPREGLEATLLQVNFLGTRQFTQALSPHLAPGSSVVNMASRAGAGWRDNLDQVLRLGALTDAGDIAGFIAAEGIDATRAYNLSKEAVIAWTAALTEEMIGRDIRVNSISPGAVATGILDDFARAFGERMVRNVERAGRAGTPQEIAGVAAFLMSPDAAWIKGIDIPVDGGMGGFNMADLLGLGAMKGPLRS